MYIYEIWLSNLESKIVVAQIQLILEYLTRSEPKDQQHAASLSSRPSPPRPRLWLFDQDEGGHPGRHGRRHDWQCWPCPSDALWVTLFKMMVVLVMMVVTLVIVKTISIPGNPWRGIPKWCDCKLRKYWQFWQEISCRCPLNLIYQYIYCTNLLMIIEDWFQCHECQIIWINVQCLRLPLNRVICIIMLELIISIV